MQIVKYALFTIMGLIVLGFSFTFAYAHTTIQVDPYEIEVGWQDEPPVVGILNAITIDVREPGSVEGVSAGITNAFKKLEVSVVSGGASKVLDVNTDPRPGHYYAKIIPTKTGSLQLKLKGEINGVQIDTVIPIEDVESTSVLDFPPTSSSSSGQEVAALKNAITSLQKDISLIKDIDEAKNEFIACLVISADSIFIHIKFVFIVCKKLLIFFLDLISL